MKNFPLRMFAIAFLFMHLGGSLPAQCEVLQKRILEVGELHTEILATGIENRKPGKPLVIFQNALGSTLETWDTVFEEVASFAPVLTYNRPGIGTSDGSGSPPTVARISKHLQELLSVLKAPPPYILVGHSWGGPLILHFAGEHPEEVIGLVLIDPPDWNQEGIFPVDRATMAAQGYDSAQVDSLILRRDSLVLEWESSMEQWAVNSPGIAAEWHVFQSFMSTPLVERGMPSSPPVPITILVAGRVEPLMQFSEDMVRAYRASRYQSFSRLILNLKNSMLIIDTDAGHEIHVDNPTLVSEAIRRFILHSGGLNMELPN